MREKETKIIQFMPVSDIWAIYASGEDETEIIRVICLALYSDGDYELLDIASDGMMSCPDMERNFVAYVFNKADTENIPAWIVEEAKQVFNKLPKVDSL